MAAMILCDGESSLNQQMGQLASGPSPMGLPGPQNGKSYPFWLVVRPRLCCKISERAIGRVKVFRRNSAHSVWQNFCNRAQTSVTF